MKRIVGLALTAAVVFGTGGAAQADGYGTKDGYRPFSWSGFYVGVHAGMGIGNTKDSYDLPVAIVSGDFTANGAMAGGQIGYNWRTGSTVVGIEASYSFSTVEGSGMCVAPGITCKREVDSVGQVVGRLGYAADRSLVYVLGGIAWADVNSNVTTGPVTIASDSQNHFGWVAGLGLEYALSKNVTARIEYRHIDLGSEAHASFLGPVLPQNIDVTIDTVQIGVNYKF